MYLWDTNALVEDLKRGPLPETEQLKYLMFALVSTTLGVSLPSDTSEALTLMKTVNVILSVLFVVAGTVSCFRANAAGDNKDFLSRYVALHVPLSLRLLAILVLFTIALGFVLGFSFLGELAAPGAVNEGIDIAFGAVIAVAFYWRLRVRIQEVANVG